MKLRSKIVVDLSTVQANQVLNFNRHPRQRAVAARMLNEGARDVIRRAQKLADAELKERPENRRRNKGPRYRDSFRVLPQRQQGMARMEAGFENFHPFARGLEKGSRPHKIPQRAGTFTRFPYTPKSTRSKRRGPPGNWPVTFEEADTMFAGFGQVDHPGTPDFRFIKRARDQYSIAARRRAAPARRFKP